MGMRQRIDRLEDAAAGPETLWVGGLRDDEPETFRRCGSMETRTRAELANEPGRNVLLQVVYITPPPIDGVI